MQEYLQKFLSFFKKKEASVFGIDVGSSSIKIVQIRKKEGRAVLETYGELALGSYAGMETGRATHLDTSQLTTAILDLMKAASITTKRCGVSIPLTSSLVSVIEVPTSAAGSLEQMVPIEVRKYIPVPISEVVLDWSIIPKDSDAEASPIPDAAVSGAGANGSGTENENGAPQDSSGANAGGAAGNASPRQMDKTEVLVVAIHNEALQREQDIVKNLNFDAIFFEVELFSAVRSVLDDNIAPYMIFDMGARSTKIYIIERGTIRYVHTIMNGSQDFTLNLARSMNIQISEAENLKRNFGLEFKQGDKAMQKIAAPTLNYIFSEGNKVLTNYQAKHSKVVNKVILTGGGVKMKGFAELAKEVFSAEEITLADPFSRVDVPAFMADTLKEAGPSFSVAVGAAMRAIQEIS